MTDAAMASLSTISTTGLGLPAGGMEALKYAAQADMFQDDPNFYAWLEEWTGKGDDESIMIDAFNTLTDYGMQFEFQQQQQQQLESSASAVRFPAEENAFLAGNNSLNAETALPQKLHQAQLGSLPGAASSCPSLASNCISRPGERNCHWGLRSPPESSVGNSSASLSSAALSPYSFSSCPAAPDAATAMAMSVAPEVNPNSGSAGISAASDAGPFDAASFIAPLTRGLDTYHVPADVSCLLGNSIDPAASTPPSAFPEIRVPSHGTVTSYAGAPSPIVQNSVSNPGPPAAGPPVVGTTTTAPGSGGGLRPELLNAPSLEQLIVRAICGNCVGAVDGRRAADPATANPSSGVAGGLSSLGMAVLGAGGFGHPSTAIGSGVAGEMGASALTSCFVRDSSGSLGDGATDSAVCSMDEDSRSGSGRFTSLGMPTQQGSSMRSMPTTCAGGPSAGARTHGLRLKSSFSGGPAGPHAYGWHGHGHGHGPPHHHYHGNPVSNIHRHSHVGKAVAAACGVGGSRSMVGVNAYGKPTRSARSKAVFAALEAEVAGKLSELEALQHENATLTQRVEILEVAVERQSSVLNLMTAAITAERGTAAAATSATRAAPARPPVGGEAAVKQSWPLPGIDTGAENATTMAAGKVPASASESAAGRDLVATGPELLEWARKCTLEMYVAWYKEHLQDVSMTLLALEDSSPDPEVESRLVQLVASCWLRTSLVCIFQPLTQLRLKGLNLETNKYAEPPEQHWMDVIKFMTVSPQQVAEMENLFHSYNLLHGSFRAELQDTQREVTQMVEAHDSVGHEQCTHLGLAFAIQQTALLKRVRSILQKTHLLYSSTIGVAAMRILKPKEFAKCSVQSYPYYPCGPSLMRACCQLRSMKAIWGAGATGCNC